MKRTYICDIPMYESTITIKHDLVYLHTSIKPVKEQTKY